MSSKTCAKCKLVFPFENFSPHRRMRDGRQSYCKPCSRKWHHENQEYVKQKNAAWRKANPNYQRAHQRLVKLGATEKWVAEMIDKQGNRCAGCLRGFDGTREHVDHCHETGKLRGLLCRECNLTLGFVSDSIETLTRLIAYLKEAEAY